MTEKTRRYIFIGIAIILAMALLHRLFPMIQSFSIPEEEIDLKVRKLAKYHSVVAETHSMEKKYNLLTKQKTRLESGFLPGKTTALAAVYVQNLLKDIAEKSKIQIKSIRVLREEAVKDTPYIKIPVQFQMNCDITTLKDLLFEIQKAPKYLKVVRLRLRRSNGKDTETIFANMIIEGIMKKLQDKN